jgi:hypothetical protein
VAVDAETIRLAALLDEEISTHLATHESLTAEIQRLQARLTETRKWRESSTKLLPESADVDQDESSTIQGLRAALEEERASHVMSQEAHDEEIQRLETELEEERASHVMSQEAHDEEIQRLTGRFRRRLPQVS